jgi:uncharacterized membrane protein YgdD (TMEM256/DUF423 family)
MGAFAAHSLGDGHPRELIRTGAAYGLVHAVGALALEGRAPWAAVCLAAGGLVFSASLYLLAMGGPPLIGAVTPLGGLLMIAGWMLAGFTGLRAR